jgi:hypothetical protein
MQHHIKEYLYKYEMRVWCLSEAWELHRALIVRDCMMKKATKKQKALLPKLTGLSDTIKSGILKLYLNR